MRIIIETHVAVAIVTMVTVNIGAETIIPVTLVHGRRKARWFRKYNRPIQKQLNRSRCRLGWWLSLEALARGTVF